MDLLESRPAKLHFRNRGTPIPPELRPIWRISVLALILQTVSRANKSSTKKLLALSNIITSKKKMLVFEKITSKKLPSSAIDIRYDPAVNRAIEIARAEGLFQVDENRNIQLTKLGTVFAKKILQDESSLQAEKEFLSKFSKNDLSEKVINQIIMAG
jgi:hypothetical protein